MKTMKPAAKLAKPPKPPKGVKYALTVTESVLFKDLSHQANRREYMEAALHIDYEMSYNCYDAGAISWNYDTDWEFNKALIAEGTPHDAIKRFIADMGITSRKLLRRSELRTQTIRRAENVEDLVQDLAEYWQAMKLHMTCLSTFWNVEHLLGDLITEELKRLGLYNNVTDLERFVKPAETNQFLRERRSFERIVKRFATDSAEPSLAFKAALEQHALEFSFLLTLYNNLDNPQSDAALLERAAQTRQNLTSQATTVSAIEAGSNKNDSLKDLPYKLRQLAFTARDLSFWKNERLDVMSLADALVAPMYQSTADILHTSMKEIFAMTSGEITQSLLQGRLVVDDQTRAERQKAFCLVFHNGRINFYQPSKPKDRRTTSTGSSSHIQGTGASGGVVSGPAVIILSLADLKQIQPGDILITPMTRPEYGVALDRAAAFVTDEGGLLCHAAIIAREMAKPCVIATGNATKILKTGDQVEVDGTQGTAKIIN